MLPLFLALTLTLTLNLALTLTLALALALTLTRSLADAHGLPCGSVTEAPQEMPTRVVRGMGEGAETRSAE